MNIRRDGGHPRDAEVPDWYRVPQLLEPWKHEAAEAGIHVQGQLPATGEGPELCDGIHYPVWILGC